MLGSVTAASATAPAPESGLGTGGGAGAPRRGNGNGTPVSGPLPADPMRGAREAPGSGVSSNGGSPDGVKPGYTPTGARIGRNDPCWCGSGNKYKKCHGK
jgi:preprotein translocase subunit SecA